MAKTRVCDCCGSEITRTYGVHTKKAKKGTGSAVIAKSRRRRLLNWLLGPLLRISVYTNSGDSGRWNKLDLCKSCSKEIRREVRERVNGDE